MATEVENQAPVEEPTDSTPPPADAQSEIQEYLAASQQRQRVFPRAALVGLGAGIMVALFRATLAGADALRNALIGWAHHFPIWGWILPVLFSAVGAILSVALVRRLGMGWRWAVKVQLSTWAARSGTLSRVGSRRHQESAAY